MSGKKTVNQTILLSRRLGRILPSLNLRGRWTSRHFRDYFPRRSSRTHVGNPNFDLFAGFRPADENDETFNPSDALAALRAVYHSNLVLLSSLDRFAPSFLTPLRLLLPSASSGFVSRGTLVPVKTPALTAAPVAQNWMPKLPENLILTDNDLSVFGYGEKKQLLEI